MIVVAFYANNSVRFCYFVVKQRSFIVLNLTVLRRDRQLVDLCLVFYRNGIGMSFPYKECELVTLTFSKTSFMKRINMHLSSPIYILCFSDTVSEVC